jgi:hypothetical protein
MSRRRSCGRAEAWTTLATAVIIGWSCWLWVTHVDTLPAGLVFGTGFAAGVTGTYISRAVARRVSRRLGIQVTRAGRGRR